MARRVTRHTQEESIEQLSTTEVSPSVARAVSWVFVVLICAVPLLQIAIEVSRAQRPQFLNLFTPLATGRLRLAFSSSFIHGFEEDLERASVAKSYVQPRIQSLLTSAGGFGNDKSVVGRDGWLFYQPGIDYVSGPNLLDERHLKELARSRVDRQREPDPRPDPRPAIRRFAAELKKQGIWLVVLPAPDKASVQPAELTSRMNLDHPAATPNNEGYTEFIRQMRAAGVDVFDAVPEEVATRQIRFLRQDTHWTPTYMDEISTQLAEHISRAVALPPKSVSYEIREQQVSRVGDLVDMLNLAKDQSLYAPQTETIRMVVDKRTGKPIGPNVAADVLVLGDSYTNIYSQPEMGWGNGAGFAEHLAYHLRRSVDVIAFNGGGSSRTRSELARPENAERLGYKKVVVFEFAARDLLGENWTPLPVITVKTPAASPAPDSVQTSSPTPVSSPDDKRRPKAAQAEAPVAPDPVTKAAGPPPAPAADAPLIVVGQILKVSAVPRPGSVPYKDCLSLVRLRVEKVESGAYSQPEIVVAFQVMRDNLMLPAAQYNQGDRLRMTLLPLNKAERSIRSMQRTDDLDDFDHQPYYAMEEGRR